MPQYTTLSSPANGVAGEGSSGAAPVTWVDIDTSKAADRDWVGAQDNLSASVKQRLLESGRANRHDHMDDGLFVSLLTGTIDTDSDGPQGDGLVNLRLFLSKNRAITARAGTLLAIDDLRDHVATSKTLTTSMDLLGFAAASFASRLDDVIIDIAEDIDLSEDRLLDHDIVPDLDDLNRLRRRIFRARRQLTSLRHVLTLIATDPTLELDADDSQALIKSSQHVTHHLENLEDCRDRAQLLHDQIDSHLAKSLARSNFNLAIVATVFLPLTFVTGLLGMNVAGIPEARNPFGFWTVCIGLSLIAFALWNFLHRGRRH